MNIEEKLNNLYKELEKIENEGKKILKEVKKLRRVKNRAKNEAAKKAIQTYDINPLLEEANNLYAKNKEIETQIIVIENHVLKEELETRKNSNTVTNIDNKFSTKLRFLFSSLRRFGNFTGYLDGRVDETEKYLQDNAIISIVEKQFLEISEGSYKEKVLQEAEIEKDDKNANKKLKKWLMGRITDEEIEARINEVKKGVIGESLMPKKSDRENMIKRFMSEKSRNTGKGPYDALNARNEQREQNEEEIDK